MGMKFIYRLLPCLLLLIVPSRSECCTSVIISGKNRPDGRPVMMKNRDSNHYYNHVAHFKGRRFRYVGLVNSDDDAGAVWGGTNEKGFCIMNTASYNLWEASDGITRKEMDKEGEFMAAALGVCADRKDFEKFLDTLSRPMRVETNIGIIDAGGSAVYYEIGNLKWKSYDVNDPAVAPKGWLVRTNFSFCGRDADRAGVERYDTALSVMEDAGDEVYTWGHTELLDRISRCYRHSVLGIDARRDLPQMIASGMFTGAFPNQDFIPRKNTVSALVFEGVKPGEHPLNTVMWAALGYPACSVAFPVLVADRDRLPAYMVKDEGKKYCEANRYSRKMLFRYVFHYKEGAESAKYFDMENIVLGKDGAPSLIECVDAAQRRIDEDFAALRSGMRDKTHTAGFFRKYEEHVSGYFSWQKLSFQRYPL